MFLQTAYLLNEAAPVTSHMLWLKYLHYPGLFSKQSVLFCEEQQVPQNGKGEDKQLLY